MALRNVVDSQALPVDFHDAVIELDPIALLQPYRLHSDNAVIPHKTVLPYGPQSGDPGKGEVNYHTNGLSLTPEVRAWLELAGQRQTGLTVRHDRGAVPEPWDAAYVVQPQDGSVL
jgi:hypothetical protein